jgi:hypothetical protein
MTAMVSANYLGDPEFEQVVRCRVQEFMESYEGHWIIRLTGSQQNTVWELKVETPDGTKEWVTTLFGKKGSHSIDKILIELRNIVENG